jgi:hypothetical protein
VTVGGDISKIVAEKVGRSIDNVGRDGKISLHKVTQWDERHAIVNR